MRVSHRFGPALVLLFGVSLVAPACQPTPTPPRPTLSPSPAATALLGEVKTLTPIAAPATATTPPSTATIPLPTLTPTSLPSLTPTPTPSPTATPTLEPKAWLAQAMLLAINAERARSDAVTPAFSQGLAPVKPPPLAWDERVARVADAYARDMATRGFFSHTSPEGKTPEARLRDAEIDFSLATENIYMAREPGAVETAMTWFMQDQLHRDSILNPRYNRTGIGVYIQDGMVYFVQMFITTP